MRVQTNIDQSYFSVIEMCLLFTHKRIKINSKLGKKRFVQGKNLIFLNIVILLKWSLSGIEQNIAVVMNF